MMPDIKDIHLADKDSKILSMSYGIVKVEIVNYSNNNVNLTINNISYLPDLRYNLLYVTYLMEKG